MKTIADYCKQEVPGWTKLPVEFCFARQGEEHLTCSFMSQDGIQIIASIRDYGKLKVLHASIGEVRSLRPELNEDEMAEFIEIETPRVLQTFFGNRGFAQQPDDPRRPTVKHWFSPLED